MTRDVLYLAFFVLYSQAGDSLVTYAVADPDDGEIVLWQRGACCRVQACIARVWVWRALTSTAAGYSACGGRHGHRPERDSAEREPATLTFSGIQTLPTHHEIFLIDDARGLSLNLRADSLCTFIPRSEITKFRVLVGKIDAVEQTLNAVVPQEFELGPNYPNPFNPTTKIPVAVPVDSEISLRVYNIRGQEVSTIYSGQVEAGRHLFEWDGKAARGKGVASGVYIYRLTRASKVALTGKMVLMR